MNNIFKSNSRFAVLSDDFNPELFKIIMEHKRKIEAGADQYSVDVSLGQIMADPSCF